MLLLAGPVIVCGSVLLACCEQSVYLQMDAIGVIGRIEISQRRRGLFRLQTLSLRKFKLTLSATGRIMGVMQTRRANLDRALRIRFRASE